MNKIRKIIVSILTIILLTLSLPILSSEPEANASNEGLLVWKSFDFVDGFTDYFNYDLPVRLSVGDTKYLYLIAIQMGSTDEAFLPPDAEVTFVPGNRRTDPDAVSIRSANYEALSWMQPEGNNNSSVEPILIANRYKYLVSPTDSFSGRS